MKSKNQIIVLTALRRSVQPVAGAISTSYRLDSTESSEETSQQWRGVSDTVSDLAGPGIEPQISSPI